jgi:hypothetical protein
MMDDDVDKRDIGEINTLLKDVGGIFLSTLNKPNDKSI